MVWQFFATKFRRSPGVKKACKTMIGNYGMLFEISPRVWLTVSQHLLKSLQWRHNGRDSVSKHQPPVYSGADERRHQSFASLAFERGIHQSPVNSPHRGPITQKMFPFDDVIMYCQDAEQCSQSSTTSPIININHPESLLKLISTYHQLDHTTISWGRFTGYVKVAKMCSEITPSKQEPLFPDNELSVRGRMITPLIGIF